MFYWEFPEQKLFQQLTGMDKRAVFVVKDNSRDSYELGSVVQQK
jgi:hypothetical protein